MLGIEHRQGYDQGQNGQDVEGDDEAPDSTNERRSLLRTCP